MSSQFKSVELFGGAIIAEIPSTFDDVSDIRQVPDNQEVYIDRSGFTSIVFDILERVEHGTDTATTVTNDEEALKYHLHGLVETDARSTTIHHIAPAHLTRMPQIPTLSLLATTPPGEKMRGRANEPDFVAILLVLVRLESQKTDLLVAINVPHVPGEYVADKVRIGDGNVGALVEAGLQVRERVLESLEVKDWDLFVQE